MTILCGGFFAMVLDKYQDKLLYTTALKSKT
jgi:hypothetical protein